MDLAQHIRNIPDFPVAGIQFKSSTGIPFNNSKGQYLTRIRVESLQGSDLNPNPGILIEAEIHILDHRFEILEAFNKSNVNIICALTTI